MNGRHAGVSGPGQAGAVDLRRELKLRIFALQCMIVPAGQKRPDDEPDFTGAMSVDQRPPQHGRWAAMRGDDFLPDRQTVRFAENPGRPAFRGERRHGALRFRNGDARRIVLRRKVDGVMRRFDANFAPVDQHVPAQSAASPQSAARHDTAGSARWRPSPKRTRPAHPLPATPHENQSGMTRNGILEARLRL